LTALIGIGVLSCIIAICFLAWRLKDFDPFSSDYLEPAVIEGNARIQLPPSARDIHAHTDGFREIFTQARFTMDAADLPGFLEDALCSEPPASIDPAVLRSPARKPSWWKPMDAQYLLECTGQDEHFYQHILIDISDSETVIVYVSASIH